MTGPQLEALTRRLAETPAEFLAPPALPGRAGLHVAAIVNDVASRLGARLPAAALVRLAGDGRAENYRGKDSRADDNRLGVCAVLAWLLADDWFVAACPLPAAMDSLVDLLGDTAAGLAQATRAVQFVGDPERREELARVALARLGYRPAGETPEQAADRLTAISGVERRRLLEASRASEERARAIRDALARQAAEEAADKWSRE